VIDYSNKDWLRPAPFSVRALHFVLRVLVLAAAILAFSWIISRNEARAGDRQYAVLFENSLTPISFAEAQRTRRDLARPVSCISLQSRTNEPWHHRVCFYETDK